MTESEAIKTIEDYVEECNYTWTIEQLFTEYVKRRNKSYVSYTADDVIDHCWSAFKFLEVKALNELLEYRKLGTVEEIKSLKDNGAFSTKELVMIRSQQMELEEYKKLGTIVEVRSAIEKSHVQNIIYKGTYLRSHCPSCHRCIGWGVEDQYCRYCGQKLESKK